MVVFRNPPWRPFTFSFPFAHAQVVLGEREEDNNIKARRERLMQLAESFNDPNSVKTVASGAYSERVDKARKAFAVLVKNQFRIIIQFLDFFFCHQFIGKLLKL